MAPLVTLFRRRPVQDRAGSPHARFSECYEAEYRPLLRFVGRLAGRRVDAADVVQEAFARLWLELERGVPIASPRAWLYRVVTNLTINLSKKRGREAEAAGLPEPAAPGDLERDAARRELVERTLASLSEPMRQALLLTLAGLSGAEIAEVLGVKPSYVGTLVLRAHERFRREFDALERR